jgi:uncharacterized protein YbaP (TraB family)
MKILPLLACRSLALLAFCATCWAAPSSAADLGGSGNEALAPLVAVLVPGDADAPKVRTARQEVTQAIEGTPRRGLLYAVEKDNAVVYLYGATDWSRPGLANLPLSSAAAHALVQSRVVALPLDYAALAADRENVLARSLYPADDLTSRHVPEPLLQRVAALLAPGAADKSAQWRDRPWLLDEAVRTQALIRIGMTTEWGSYAAVASLARSLGKDIKPLGSWADLADLRSALPEDAQTQGLSRSVDAIIDGSFQRLQGQLSEAWLDGDQPRLDALAGQARERGLEGVGMAVVSAAQVRAVVAEVDRLLAAPQTSGPAFVMVNAASLLGGEGLLSQLRKRRLSVVDAHGKSAR